MLHLIIDLQHELLYKDAEPAPAAGWFKSFHTASMTNQIKLAANQGEKCISQNFGIHNRRECTYVEHSVDT